VTTEWFIDYGLKASVIGMSSKEYNSHLYLCFGIVASTIGRRIAHTIRYISVD